MGVRTKSMLNINDQMMLLLRKCLVINRPDLLKLIDSEELIINEELGNKLREAVLDELIKEGFNEKNEPNDYGMRLEELIDQLGRLFM